MFSLSCTLNALMPLLQCPPYNSFFIFFAGEVLKVSAGCSMGLLSLAVVLSLLAAHPYQALGSDGEWLSPFSDSVSSKAEAAAAFADIHAAFHTKVCAPGMAELILLRLGTSGVLLWLLTLPLSHADLVWPATVLQRADGSSGIKSLYSQWKARFKPSYPESEVCGGLHLLSAGALLMGITQ